MTDFSIDDIGLKVGLEIHQQLDTKKKLFCNCTPTESDEYYLRFQRKLRPVKSELGRYDPASLFENAKEKTIVYYANPQSSCLVEQDEEPPHEVDGDAKDIALTVASALGSRIFSEIYPMRKSVIDGSNTGGFQRTMLISQGGSLEVDGKKIGVQSICLEEDAAKLLGDKGDIREYSLERLGVPLVEIALEPVEGKPSELKKIALSLGRLLRSTKKVTRGIGSIRQDVNVSIRDGKSVVEVKGVQQLEQLEKVIEFEAKRQYGLLQITKRLQKIDAGDISEDVYDISDSWKDCKSKIIQKAIKDKSVIKAIKIRNFAGMFGFSPYEGIRLGKEIGQLVKFFGIGGVFHSDELPNYGIEEKDVKIVADLLKIADSDAFLVIAAPSSRIDFAIASIIKRIKEARLGVPAETRLATTEGETVFLRPRPGASRMYPETDIPPIIPTQKDLDKARQNIPKSWDESLKELQEKYNLNSQLAEQIFDSDYLELFENIAKTTSVSGSFIVSVLCSTITSLQREGLDSQLLKDEEIQKAFELLENKKIAKESIEIIFKNIMSAKSKTISDAINDAQIGMVDQSQVDKILDELISKNQDMINNQKERAIGPLMGMAMKELRGKVSGETINKLLAEKIADSLKGL